MNFSGSEEFAPARPAQEAMEDHLALMHDGNGAILSEESFSREPIVEAPLLPDLQLENDLRELSGDSLKALVDRANVLLRQHGYPNLHQKLTRDKAAYYHCGCGDKSCFKMKLILAAIGNKKGNHWKFDSVGERKCEPASALATALANSFIPSEVKVIIIQAYDQNSTPKDAHNLATAFASEKGLPTTWERSDVKNLFATLRRDYSGTTIEVLLELEKAGNYVEIDLRTNGSNNKILNRFFVSFKSMQQCYPLWGSQVSTLDSTYGKNKNQFPVQFFVGTTNEAALVPFSVSATRGETEADYLWLFRAFYRCYGSLPSCIIVDGDEAIANAIRSIATELGVEIWILLCIWHLFQNVKTQLWKKRVQFDEFELKKHFYGLRNAETQDMFEGKWTVFVETYGTTDDAANYLQNTIYAKKEMWARAWIGAVFTANMTTTGISESLHAQLASGSSGLQTLVNLLERVDAIIVHQIQTSGVRSVEWSEKQTTLEMNQVHGFAGAAVTRLISGKGFELFSAAADAASFSACLAIDPVDPFACNSWCVREMSGFCLVHIVSEIEFLAPRIGSEIYRRQVVIESALGQQTDHGKEVCAACGQEDNPTLEEAFGFTFPDNFENRYGGKVRLVRLLAAVGVGQPKVQGTTNNKTISGLTEVLCAYQRELKKNLGLEMPLDEAKVAARDTMASYKYDGSALGYPRFKYGSWMQCGILDGEDSVPNEFRRHYCGLWFHFECAGVLRGPKDENQRIQCLSCLQDRRYRPKTPRIEGISKAATWRGDGRPRIVENEASSSIKTLKLTCDCDFPISTGLPCAGMVKVASVTGSVLSYHAFNPHWWSENLIKPVQPVPAFHHNRGKVFDTNSVLQSTVQPRPAHVDDNLEVVRRGTVIQDDDYEPDARPRVSENGEAIEDPDFDLDEVQDGHGVSSKKRSRAFKAKKQKSINSGKKTKEK